MLHTLKLLIPALIPSWRFFDSVAPSPRIEFALLTTDGGTPSRWQEFRPRPPSLPISSMLKRLFWNPGWNENLYLVSCAEKLAADGDEHSRREIEIHIKDDLERQGIAAAYLQFRLIFLSRRGAEPHREITYVSPVYS